MNSRERDLKNNKLGLNPKETDDLVDNLTDVIMKERRKNILEDPRKARPDRMREDPTTPLIREVPFGPDTTGIFDGKETKFYDHMSHSMGTGEFESRAMDKFLEEQKKLPKEKQFPTFGDISGQGKKMMMDTTKGHEVDAHGWRVIPHGDISIPKEQERKTIPYKKRDWEHGRLKSKAEHNRKKDTDAEAIAKELLLDEGSSKHVNKITHKIRPPKPVRSDFASIITAKNGFNGIVKKETTFKVAEGNKPEYVSVVPLSFRTKKGKNGKRFKFPIRR